MTTPKRAIRDFCVWCMNGQANEVKLCPSEDCALYLLRRGRGPGSKLKPIRAKCLDCSGQNMGEINRCPQMGCSLYPFRMGKNPNIKRPDLIGRRMPRFSRNSPIDRPISEQSHLNP